MAAAAAPATEAQHPQVADAAATAAAAAAARHADPIPRADRASFAHTPCYCEENVYLLIKRLVTTEDQERLQDPESVFAVFISNRERFVPIWRQRAARAAAAPVCWDYHVLAIARSVGTGPSYVYDLDTTIEPFPAPFDDYRREALRPYAAAVPPGAVEGGVATAAAPAPPRRLYRVVPAADLLARFSSDRSHMLRADGRGWTSPPPAWPSIAAPEKGGSSSRSSSSNTLPLFLDMRRGRRRPDDGDDDDEDDEEDKGAPPPSWAGRVMSERDFFEFFAAPPPPPPP